MFSRLQNLLHRRLPTDLVGIDINPDNLKISKIDQSTTPFELQNFNVKSLPPGYLVKDEIKDVEGLANFIRELFRESQITTRQVALSIPRSFALIKNITIDSRLTHSEIESRAWLEANRFFPDLVGEIYLDFSLGEPSGSDSPTLDLTLVACRKEHVDPYIQVLKEANLIPRVVDVNCYALERMLPFMISEAEINEAIGLLNLDSFLSSFIVVHNKKLIYAHDQTYDGTRLKSEIKEYESKTEKSQELYEEILKRNLTSHLRHTMHFFYSSRPSMGIKEILLSGDCATLEGVAQFIQKETEIKVRIANPLINLKISPTIDSEKLNKLAPQLTLCCGLAISDLK